MEYKEGLLNTVVFRVCGTVVPQHSTKKQENGRQKFIYTEIKNVQHIPLVNLDTALTPPLHIKLALMKNFVKAVTKHRLNGFKFLRKKLPKLSQSKLKGGKSLLVHEFGKFSKTQSLKLL